MEKLAIYGGTPVKTTPYGTGKRFGKEELKNLEEALEQNTLFYWKGNMTKRLCKKFADMYGAEHCVATSSGTASIHVALGAVGVKPGDEVITSPITDMGSVIGIIYQNAIPVFADLDPNTYIMTPEAIEKKITKRTKAIVVVHLAGCAAEIDKIVELARKHNIPLVAANDAHVSYNKKECFEGRQIRRSCRFKKWETEIEGDEELYIKDDYELALALYQILPEDMVIEAMENVGKIVACCNATIEKGSHAPKVKGVADVKTMLRELAVAGIHKYGDEWSQRHQDRLDYELNIINSMGFDDYFVITWDIINVARKVGGLSYAKLEELIAKMKDMTMDEFMAFVDEFNTEVNISVGLGRGSGAGSIVCYLLGITNIDPFKYDLLFERKIDCVH